MEILLRIIAALLIVFAAALPAQDAPPILDDVLEDGEALDAVLAYLTDLREDPLSVNHATVSDLLAIPFLDAERAAAIVAARPFRKPADLAALPEVGSELASVLAPYLRFAPPALTRTSLRVRSGVALKLPAEERRRLDGYPGDARSWQERVRVERDGFRAVLVADKDPGETAMTDLLGGGLRIAAGRATLLAGDFDLRVAMGAGLSGGFGSTLAPGSWSGFTPALAAARLRGGAAEDGYWRGALLDLRFTSRWRSILMASRRRLDAAIDSATGIVTALPAGGLHRTATERARRDRLGEDAAALVLLRETRPFAIGGYALGRRYDRPVAGANRPDPLRRRLDAGVMWRWRYQLLQGSGEWAVTPGGGQALVTALTLRPPGWTVPHLGVVAYRYGVDFDPPEGRRTGYGSAAAGNRAGMVLLAEGRHGALRWAGLLRLSRSVEPQDAGAALTRRRLVTVTHPLGRGHLSVQIRHDRRMETNGLVRDPADGRYQVRVETVLPATGSWRLRQRVERRGARIGGRGGIALFHEMDWRGGGLRLTGRWTHFNVGASPNRLYEVEPDLPGAWRSAVLSGSGVKWVLRAIWRWRNLEAALRLREVHQEAGDGPSARVRRELHVQFGAGS